VFLADRVLSAAEIASLATRPPQPAVASSLALYWSFDNVSDSAPFNILPSYGANIGGRVLQSTFSISEGLASPPAAPTLIPSTVPLLGSGLFVAKQNDAQGISIGTLVGPNAGTASITSLPDVGQVFLLQANGQPSSSALQLADLPAPASYGIRIMGNAHSNFTYAIGADMAKIDYMVNRAPQPLSQVSAYIDQQTTAILTVGSTYSPPPTKRKETKYVLDLDGDALVCKVVALPPLGELRTSAGVAIRSADLPYEMQACKFVYVPPDEVTGSNIAYFNVSVSDGLVTSYASFLINIINRFYPPRPGVHTASIAENQKVTVTFDEVGRNSGSFQVPKSGPIIVDKPFIFVEDWPRLGRIYQVENGRVGAEIVENAPSVTLKTMWVSEGVNASSAYADPTGWSVKEIEGPPNSFPAYGSPRSNSGL
jgi:hypothetical protein